MISSFNISGENHAKYKTVLTNEIYFRNWGVIYDATGCYLWANNHSLLIYVGRKNAVCYVSSKTIYCRCLWRSKCKNISNVTADATGNYR